MKKTLIIILSSLVLCGCSQKQAEAKDRAIDLVMAGKDIAWGRSNVMRIEKRDGASLEGIHITMTASDGKMTKIDADTGTVSPGSIEDATDEKFAKIILKNPHGQATTGTGLHEVVGSKEMTIVIHK